jgi:hypothetical protein
MLWNAGSLIRGSQALMWRCATCSTHIRRAFPCSPVAEAGSASAFAASVLMHLNRTLTHPGSQNNFVFCVLPHKKNEIAWSIYAKWNVQSNMLLNTWNVLQVCPATWELPKYGELLAIEKKKKTAKRLHVFVFFPYDMPNVGIMGSNGLAGLLQMNVKVTSTESFRERVPSESPSENACTTQGLPLPSLFQELDCLTSSTRPFFLIVQLYPPPLPSCPLPSPLLSSPPLPFPLLSSPKFWCLKFVLRLFGHKDRKGKTLEVKILRYTQRVARLGLSWCPQQSGNTYYQVVSVLVYLALHLFFWGGGFL